MNGKVALVTGSSAGIGYAIATDFLKQGCSVILTGSRTEKEAEAVLKTAQEIGPSVNYIQCDLSQDVTNLCSEIDQLFPDGIDILVNNAGIATEMPLENIEVDNWNKILTINLTVPFILTKHFVPKMRRKGWGRIVNISSILGLVSTTNQAAYVSSKHGLIGLTKTVALETATAGITVNAVCPALVKTKMNTPYVKDIAISNNIDFEKAEEMMVNDAHPTKKIITARQVSAMVVHLCADVSENITGAVLTIDAGYTAR